MKKNIIGVLCSIIGLVLFANVALAADVTPPKTNVNSPANNEIVRGLVGTSCYATDDVKVTKSELYIDNVLKASGAPSMNILSFTWDTSAAAAGSHTIYCKAYDAAGNVTKSVVRTFTLDKAPDTTPPTIMGISPKNGETVSGIYKFSINAMDDYGVISKLTLYMDGKEFASCANRGDCGRGGVTSQYANGTHTLYGVAIDAAGNTTTSPVSTFTMNNLPPTVTITSPANNATVGGNFEIVANAKGTSAIGSIIFYVNKGMACTMTVLPGNLGPYKCLVDSRMQPNGKSLEIQVEAHDANGTPGTSPIVKATVYNDISNWEVKINSPVDGATVSGIVPVQAFSTNSSQTQLYVDGNSVSTLSCATCNFKWNSATVADGAHTMYVDTWWNGATYSSPVIIIATNNAKPDLGDIIKPTVSLTFPTPNYVFKTATGYDFYATASDNAGIFKVEFYDGDKLLGSDYTNPYSYKWTTSAADNGSHSIIAKAYDMKGNVGISSVVPVTVNIPGGGDTVKPTVSITAPTNNGNYTSAQAVAINASATDNVSVSKVEFYDGTTLLGADTASPYSYSWAITAANNGNHSLTAKAYDASGNSAVSAAVPVIVKIVTSDATKPTVSITAPTNNANYSTAQTVAIKATASDNVGVSKVEFYDNGNLLGTDTASSYSYSWVITAGNNGAHSLTAKAYDAAGNNAVSTAVSVTVNIATGDTTKPTVSITAPIANSTLSTISGTTSITATASDNIGVTKVEFYADGTILGTDTASPYSYSWNTAAVANGSHALTAKAYDAAGNTNVSATILVTVKNAIADTGAPTVSITAPRNNISMMGSLDINVNAYDAAGISKVEIYADNVLKGTDTSAPYSFEWDTPWELADGTHVLTAKAYNTAGKSAISPAITLTVKNGVDVTPPTVEITAPTNNSTVKGSVYILGSAHDTAALPKVDLYLDNVLMASNTIMFNWNSASVANGIHTWTAKARDAAGNTTISTPISVNVSN